VAADQVFARFEEALLRDLGQARAVFADPEPYGADERVYRIEAADEVIRRSIEMLDRAQRIAVVDAFPAALQAVGAAAERAASHGVQVFVEAYAPCDVAGANVVVVEHGAMTLQRWRGEQLNVVVDGREHIAALLSRDLSTVYQAVWSDSLYLSCLMHAGRLAEHTLVRMTRLKRQAGVSTAMRRVLDEHPFFASSQVPGHAEIVKRFCSADQTGTRARPVARRKSR
jgi:hypothetical protein